MSRERIPVAGPWITEKEVEYAADAAANAWYDRAAEYPLRFEQAMADYLGVRFAIALPHCTSAIHLSLVALGVGPGDEVVVPDLTWIATSAPIQYVGASPVFADVDPETWCLTAEALDRCVTSRTRAVIPVDLYGGMPDYDALRSVGLARDVAIVEDAAQAIGSEWRGRRSGSFGRAGVFSFHGSKTLTTGEGGMLVTDDEALHARVMRLRDHGRAPGDRFFFNDEVAYKAKMSALQAAVGLAQIERIGDLIARKREIFAWYSLRLAHVPGVQLNAEPKSVRNSYWMVTAILDESYGLRSEELMGLLDQEEIDSRPFFHPLSSIPAYRNTDAARDARARNTTAYQLSPRGISLPSALSLTEDQVDRVCNVLRRILQSR